MGTMSGEGIGESNYWIKHKSSAETYNRATDSLEALRDAIAGFDPSWVAAQLLIDADDFDVADADANTERWTPEYITGADEAAADINTTTSGQLYMKINSTGGGAREYAVARELPLGLRHFSVYADADFTWGTTTATAMRGGIMISRGSAYDANNYIRIYKEKSSSVERIRYSYNFGGGGDTAATIVSSTDDAIAFKIDRINTVFRVYYSLTQGGDAVWVLGAQIEDTSDNIDDNPSFYFNIYSVGSAATEDVQVDFDTWRLGNTFGAFVDTIVSGYDSTDVAANEDGAVMERLEQLQEAINIGAGTSLPANTSIYDALGTPQLFTASASGTTSITAAALIDQAGLYLGEIVVPLSGNMAAQGRYITAYDGTQTLSVLPAWPVAPGNVDFVVIPSEMGRILLALGTEYDGTPDIYDTIVTGYTTAVTAVVQGSILERLQLLQEALINANTIFTSSAATINTVTSAALVDRADLYEGMMLVPLTGNQSGQGRYVTAYDGTSVLTVSPDWSTDPDAAGAFTFVIMPTPMKFAYEAGKGLSAIFDIVDAIADLTRVGGTHDQSDAAGTQDTVWTIETPGGNWSPNRFVIDLTELVALDQLRLRIKYRVKSGGNMIVEIDDTFVGVPAIPLKSYDLHENRFGIIITTAQTAGTVRDWDWEVYYEG